MERVDHETSKAIVQAAVDVDVGNILMATPAAFVLLYSTMVCNCRHAPRRSLARVRVPSLIRSRTSATRSIAQA